MLVAHTLPDIQELFDRFADAARRFGLTVSLKKTEVMLQSYPTNQSATATVMAGDTILTSASKFCYYIYVEHSHSGRQHHGKNSQGLYSLRWTSAPAVARTWCIPENRGGSLPCCRPHNPLVRLRVLDPVQEAHQAARTIPHALSSQNCRDGRTVM